MHHYPFHVGDYIRATAHLDIVEDCIYRRLIDLYMETELPIPNETQQVIRRLRLGSSGLILETILKEFFTLEADNCWHNSRCDKEISEFKRLAEVSRINGKLGGRPKKTQQVILENPDITQKKPAGLQPIPNTQYPIQPLPSVKKKARTQFPDIFVPTPAHQEFARQSKLDLEHEFVKFKLHHEEKVTLSGNWNSSFSKWLHNAVEFRKPTGNNSVQDARLETARQIFGGQNGNNRPLKELNPRPANESDGEGIPKTGLVVR